MGNLIMLLSNV